MRRTLIDHCRRDSDLSNVTKAWRLILKQAKLPSSRLYHLRQTFATELLAQGTPITYVPAQLGHNEPTTTLQWYAHWLLRGDKHWVDALDNSSSKALGDQSGRWGCGRRGSD